MSTLEMIMDNIESGNLGQVYVLEGEEAFYLDKIMKAFEEKALPADAKDFNQTVLYGNETDWKQVINEARRMPMFGDKILILLKEGNQMKTINELAAYLENQSPHTTLVIEVRGKNIDKRSKFFKLIKSKATHFDAVKIKENELPSWIQNYGNSIALKIAPAEANLLAAYLGNDLQKIANELEKIKISEPEIQTLNTQHIEKYIGISREYNIFELVDAFFSGNSLKVAKMLQYFSANPKNAPTPLLIASFYNFLSRVFASYYANNFEEKKKYGVWQPHTQFGQKINLSQTQQLLLITQEYAQKSVGIAFNSSHPAALLKEYLGRMKVIIGN